MFMGIQKHIQGHWHIASAISLSYQGPTSMWQYIGSAFWRWIIFRAYSRLLKWMAYGFLVLLGANFLVQIYWRPHLALDNLLCMITRLLSSSLSGANLHVQICCGYRKLELGLDPSVRQVPGIQSGGEWPGSRGWGDAGPRQVQRHASGGAAAWLSRRATGLRTEGCVAQCHWRHPRGASDCRAFVSRTCAELASGQEEARSSAVPCALADWPVGNLFWKMGVRV